MTVPWSSQRNVWSGWRKAELMIFTWRGMDGEMMSWVQGTNESHNLEVGKSESRKWKDSNSGKGGKLRPQEMDGLLKGAEVQQRAGGKMYQALPPPPAPPGPLRHDATFSANLKCCLSTLKRCVRRHVLQESVETAGLILIALIESQP